ncbi:MAG: DUF421 domain-containing protein [Clostridia bacterium]|nr:DUF421 domain-containing protein [Clostridia bacterium]
MLIIFFRAIILFAVLLVVMRLMGKRQLGEMEPFELVITLVISELACIPMADRSIPLTYGIVAILTMFIIHQIIVIMSKNASMQKIISGKAVVVYDKKGINLFALKQMNMQVADLLQALRTTGHFSFEEVLYGVMETNGQLTVVPKKSFEEKQQTLPVPVILDGKWDEEDIKRNGIDKRIIEDFVKKCGYKVKDVAMLTVDQENRIVVQFMRGELFCKTLAGGKLVDER